MPEARRGLPLNERATTRGRPYDGYPFIFFKSINRRQKSKRLPN